MKQVLTDLWETRTDSPFPGLTTHAYLWTARNALFYSPATDADFDELTQLGGVADQYLSHRDEAGPMLQRIADRFGARLHAPVAELVEIGAHAHIDVPLGSRHVDENGVEVLPGPGHTPGSTCYQVDGAEGTYLFTGDTLFLSDGGEWTAGFIPGMSDAEALTSTLQMLATLTPDVVISSAFQGPSAVHRIDPDGWSNLVEKAIYRLSTV
ncbi:MBL fold metallo-hydrolase [Mycobacterium deserti]|uniref:MBL fold metallo-hydrolase n=1 Tax=Mycobacterium deserti TaxID=2978347 RepID=A0ABT2MH91_9MYCO|nr:MBL fold metallo-hydrolase [Mycobacterium deserti]MCT7661658.1 MBL fold metallo-hydrolase [Mycobacterium deserti]